MQGCRCRENLAQVRAESLVLLLPTVFIGDIILGNFVGDNLILVGVVCVLNAFYDLGLEGIPFLEEFPHAFRAATFDTGESLQIPGLPSRARSKPTGLEDDGVYQLGFPARSASFSNGLFP